MENKEITGTELMREYLNRFSNKFSLREVCGETSFGNPISMFFDLYGFDNNFLFEGLIKTYPPEETVLFLKKRFKLTDDEAFINDSEGVKKIFVKIYDTEDNKKIIKDALSYCGYFFSKETEWITTGYGKFVTMMFEPKHQDDISHKIREEEQFLYHVTPSYHEEKIRKIGIVTRNKNNFFNYPERVYLIRGSASEHDLLVIISKLATALGEDDEYHNNGEWTVFKIDLEKVPEHINLVQDPNYPKGLITGYNIPPDSFCNVGWVNIDGKNPKITWQDKN